MIIGAWKPRTKTHKGKTKIVYYEKVNLEKLDYGWPGNVKVIWKCDNPDCKYPDRIHHIDLGHLRSAVYDKNYHANNTLEQQHCTSCLTSGKNNVMYGKTHTDEVKDKLRNSALRTKEVVRDKYGVENISQLDETKEKKGQTLVNEENAKELCDNLDLEFLELKGNNKYAKVKVKCSKGHIFERKWTYLKSGMDTCSECFRNELKEQGVKDKKGFNLYLLRVHQFTSDVVRENFDKIEGIEKRSREWHLDHRYSILQGYKDNIPPYIIGSYYNLEVISREENSKKGSKCSLTKEQLLERYFQGDE